MDSSATFQRKDLPWRLLLVILLLATALFYVWIVPLFRPRGPFLWGHYTFRDIYLGIPVALAFLCVILPLVVPARYRRSLSLRLATASLSILLVLAVCDAGYAFGVMGAWRADFWLDQAHIPRRYSMADDELGFVRKPHISWRGHVPDVDRVVEYRTDQNGFRNPPGQQRADVVFIGDSFSEAATVAEEDTFVRRVAQATGLSTVNMARGAYGPQQELIVLKRYGLSFEPRFVIWQLFEGNDLLDAQTFAEWVNNPHHGSVSLKGRYLNNSLLNQWLANTRSRERAEPMATLRYHDGTVRRVVLRYPYEPDQPRNNPLGMAETMSAIEAGYRLCQAQGIQLLVISIPTLARVMATDISFDRVEDQMRYLPKRVQDEGKGFSDAIGELCARIGCSFIDGFEALRQAADKGTSDLYIPNDEHLDVGGHGVVAQIVEDWLRSTEDNMPE